MKRCPQCNSVFDDSLVYCTNDGTPLVEENFVIPSENSDEEEITIVHHDPITIDIPNKPTNAPTEQFNYQTPPVVETVVVQKPRNTGKYFLFLILGLVLGGSLVLAAVIFSMFYFRDKQTPAADTANKSSSINSTQTPKTATTATPVTPSGKHAEKTDSSDSEFNGRVIAQSAYVRYSPSRDAMQIDVLPVNDRLTIEERESENSPWFRVTCEHGTSGWMHGNTIEYTK